MAKEKFVLSSEQSRITGPEEWDDNVNEGGKEQKWKIAITQDFNPNFVG